MNARHIRLAAFTAIGLALCGVLCFDLAAWFGYMSVRETWYGVTPELVRNFFFGWRG